MSLPTSVGVGGGEERGGEGIMCAGEEVLERRDNGAGEEG